MFAPDGKWLASGGADNSIKIWDTSTGRELRALSGHTGSVWSAVFSPDGRRVASGGADKTVRVWDLGTKERASMAENAEPLRGLAITPDGKRFVAQRFLIEARELIPKEQF